MFPVELTPELREQIVSYLGVWEFISCSFTCRQALQDVEVYSRRELDRIEREHNVDDTWRFRVGMQAAQDAFTRLSSSEARQDGVMLMPNNISFRRMLRSAYRTHLYSIGTTPTCGYQALAMHPNGKYLLSGGRGPQNVCVWNVPTKECIKVFSEHQRCVDNVGFSAGHVVSSSIEERTVSIWSMDGARKHHDDIEGDVDTFVRDLAVTDDSVYAEYIHGPISVINTIAGTVAFMEQPWGDAHSYPVDLCVCMNNLLYMRGNENLGYDDEEEQRSEDNKGLYIFDRDSMEVRTRLVGDFCSIACASDGGIAVSTSRGEIQVFQMQEDGNVVPRLTIVEAVLSNLDPRDIILHMTNSQIFVKDRSLGARQSRILVYNAMNGVLERRLVYPTVDCAVTYYPSCMASNDTEVFVGFSFGDESHRASSAIKAFLRSNMHLGDFEGTG